MDGWLLRDALLGAVGSPTADLRIHGGVVVEVGSGLVGAGEVVVPLGGRRVVPGLRDAHVHFTTWAWHRQHGQLNEALARATSAADAARAVVDARGTDRRRWIRGDGFRQATWSDAPHKALLDAAAPGQPVVLSSQDLHTSWWSSAALAAIGLDHPDGHLREQESWQALERIPPVPVDEDDRVVAEAVAAAARRGVTAVVDYELGGAVGGWRRRAATGPLPLRVTAAVMGHELDATLDAQLRTGQQLDDAGRLVLGNLKLFTDGALGSRTAWCDHHFVGEPDNHGRSLLGTEELVAVLERSAAGGVGASVHAIGDAANRQVLDAFAATGIAGTVEHAQLLDPADLGRIGTLAGTASVQPSHAVDDRDLAERWWADRLDRAYPLRSLQDAGVRLAFGSDAPVAPLDPWRSIAAAVARTLDELPPWLPEQAIDLADALRWSTAGPLVVGAPADLAVLGVDPFTLAPTDLAALPVERTMVAGTWTHGRPD